MPSNHRPSVMIRPEELHDPARFEMIAEFGHTEMVGAINAWLVRPSPVLALYVLANLAALAGAAWAVRTAGISLMDGVSQVCLGMVAGYALLVPVHEWVHALAYRSIGAKSVSVTYRWRSLTAFCLADRFVARARPFAWVAAAPFLVINPLLAAVVLVGPPAVRPLAAGALLLHVGACSGDAGLLNYLWAHRGEGVLTYDDAAAARSWFFRPVHKAGNRE